MATKQLSNNELKAYWLQGSVVNAGGNYLSFDEMISEHKRGNTVYVNKGDEVIVVDAPLPKWMVWSVLTLLPVVVYLTSNAMGIAGY